MSKERRRTLERIAAEKPAMIPHPRLIEAFLVSVMAVSSSGDMLLLTSSCINLQGGFARVNTVDSKTQVDGDAHLVCRELADGVGHLLCEDRDETSVESRHSLLPRDLRPSRSHVSQILDMREAKGSHLQEAWQEARSVLRVRDEPNARCLERGEENVGEKLGSCCASEVDEGSVANSALVRAGNLRSKWSIKRC